MRGAEKDGADPFADQRLAFGHVLWLPFPFGALPGRRGGFRLALFCSGACVIDEIEARNKNENSSASVIR
jgi:hypothetical protein